MGIVIKKWKRESPIDRFRHFFYLKEDLQSTNRQVYVGVLIIVYDKKEKSLSYFVIALSRPFI